MKNDKKFAEDQERKRQREGEKGTTRRRETRRGIERGFCKEFANEQD